MRVKNGGRMYGFPTIKNLFSGSFCVFFLLLRGSNGEFLTPSSSSLFSDWTQLWEEAKLWTPANQTWEGPHSWEHMNQVQGNGKLSLDLLFC